MGPEVQQTNLPRDRHSTLVRIWRETSSAQWRVWVQHVRTGESQTFHSLDELLVFVKGWEENQDEKTGKGLK